MSYADHQGTRDQRGVLASTNTQVTLGETLSREPSLNHVLAAGQQELQVPALLLFYTTNLVFIFHIWIQDELDSDASYKIIKLNKDELFSTCKILIHIAGFLVSYEAAHLLSWDISVRVGIPTAILTSEPKDHTRDGKWKTAGCRVSLTIAEQLTQICAEKQHFSGLSYHLEVCSLVPTKVNPNSNRFQSTRA